MATASSHSRTNRELLKALSAPVARFYPCDLHVHSPGSFDVCIDDKFNALPQDLRVALQAADTALHLPLQKEPPDHGEFDRRMTTRQNVQAFLKALRDRRDALATDQGIPDSDNWSIVGVTDHNTAHFSAAAAEAAWETRKSDRLIVLPGLELEIVFPLQGAECDCQVHVLCLYAPGTSASDIRLAINESRPTGADNWDFGTPIAVSDVQTFIRQLRTHQRYPAICIAAHVGSKKGMENEPKKLILASLDVTIARLEGELERARAEAAHAESEELTARLNALMERRSDDDGLHGDVLKLIGQCGFDALQVRDQTHEMHYRRLHRFRDEQGRAIPIVSSDAHSPSAVFACSSGVPYAKLCVDSFIASDPKVLFNEIRNRALRFGETRTTYASPGAVTHWIEGIEIVPDAEGARRFWRVPADDGESDAGANAFTLPLSRNLNCFVGGRGSGKSAGVEAISFLTETDQFTQEGAKRERDRSEWYRRSAATLSGCRLRLVWKASGGHPISALPKGALIVSRYFDPDGQHSDFEVRDADGNAIVDDHISVPQIRILRVHEIEQTAESGNLRRLFDDLCGSRITDLNQRVSTMRQELITQRQAIVRTCTELSELTKDGSPLRQFGIRKQQFERVDKPELRTRFEEVDRAAAVGKAAAHTRDSWGQTNIDGRLLSVEADITQFFETAANELTDAEGAVRTGYESLHDLVRPTAPPEQPGHREILLQAVRSANSAVEQFSQTLDQQATDAGQVHEARRDDLAREGLPLGSSERESKKKSFEAAETDHQTYKTLCAELQEHMKTRDELHGQLVEACRERTNLRRQRAEELTAQLSRDLDQEVLRIEVDARPLADRHEFEAWLEKNVDHAFPRYKPHRRAALLESGLMPRQLRDILLDGGTPDLTQLHVDRDRAEDGRIDAEDSLRILEKCRGRKRVPLDESETWDPAYRDSLPDDIRNGVLTFPPAASPPDLCISRVLELDEIVLDDMPEVRLNDRPTDQLSEPRVLDQLSPGQRCSAILPILLLSGDYPLVIDQPEENLDNRLIRQVIVNILASMKLRRQVIIATHNPNLPVLGDVEQCVVLQATGRDLSSVVATGNLDSPVVARYITDIMEGGREAFQYRQSIYQSHWSGPIELQP